MPSFMPNKKEFIEFVLSNYIKDSVDELDDSKLGKLITLKYKSNTDAIKNKHLGESLSLACC